MKTNTYVNFHGNCAEAFRYYEKHLGAKIGMMMTHAQSPGQSQVDPEWKDAVLHARMFLGDAEVWAADIPNADPMRSAYLTLRMDSDSDAERVFSVLSEGGQDVDADARGVFRLPFRPGRDQFGINWMILHERPLSRQQ